MQGFITRARNRGDVVAYGESVYMENAGDSYEPPHVPRSSKFPYCTENVN